MNFSLDLNTIWFGLVGVLFIGYALLDGFDLGVGALHLLADTDRDRRLMLNAIGPVWDGNEVWLVTGGGALFAAFPEVYATVFSGFYVAFMLFLFALIFRAVAIEFRSKQPSRLWRLVWDVSFSLSSILGSVLVGVALGNIARGIPLDAQREFAGNFWSLLNPYALMVGVTTVALFTMHGAIYVVMKTEGFLQKRAREWARYGVIFFVICYVVTTMVTLLYVPHMVVSFRKHPVFLAVPILTLLAIANIPRELYHGNELRAFLSSSASMVGLLTLFGLGMFPYLVYSNPHPQFSLTVYNAASSPKTLKIMLIIAAMGMPLVLAYTIAIYRVFRGKVRLTSSSY